MTEGHKRSEAGATLPWPPPGLERMQGDLGQVAARAALAGGLLVLPMLFVVAREQGFATLGPFADAWWVTVVLTSVGLAFSFDAFVHAARILRRAARAMGNGHDPGTVWQVVADTGRDMGFLLQGARHFAMMDARERQAIVRIRMFSMTLHAASGLWLSLALGVGLLAAARGLVSPTGLWMATLLPSAAGYAFGGVGRVVNDARVRRARTAYHVQPWSEDLVAEEIAIWRARRAEVSGARPAQPAPGRLGPPLRYAAVLLLGFAVLVAVPVLTLLPASVVGPVLSTLATPRFDRARQRAALAEGYRSYATPVDPSVSPEEAGRLLHDLSNVALEPRGAMGEREPSRRVTVPWLPESGDANPMGIDPFTWGDSLIDVVAAGTTGAQRAYLAQVAAHPMRADFSRLASAGDLDAASARWESPFPPEVTVATMPIPRFTALRTGANAHIGAAAYELTRGRLAPAEALLSDVIAVGFLMGDHGPTLLDNMIGFALVESGGRALEDLYAASGQDAKRVELRRSREAAERAATRVPASVTRSTEGWVRSLPAMVLDTTVARGLRWEYFLGVTSLSPCLNLHRMVFGPDDDYTVFLDRAHEALVRFPSEEGLFALARDGWLSTLQSDRDTWIGRVMSVSMRRGRDTCGDAVRRIEATDVLG